nr:DUF4241 domain-containing protein [uncultured Flavobacterium sp.]
MKKADEIEIPFDLKAEMDERELVKIHTGDVNLPTGRIVVADPFLAYEQPAFSKTVEPDKYPVYIYVSEIDKLHHRIAYAKIKFRPESATRWILALTEDVTPDEIEELEEDEYFGFDVESGLAGFMDEETRDEFTSKLDTLYETDEEYDYYDAILAEEFKAYSGKNNFSRELGDWNDHKPTADSDNNIIMFSSGWGDGYFPAYWGYNDNGDIVELAVDFLLDEYDNEGDEE